MDELAASPPAAHAWASLSFAGRVLARTGGPDVGATPSGHHTVGNASSASAHRRGVPKREAAGLDSQLQRLIQDFASGQAVPVWARSMVARSSVGDEQLLLPISLTAFQRRQAHELAQALGLGHTSEGTEHSTRRVVLSRAPPQQL